MSRYSQSTPEKKLRRHHHSISWRKEGVCMTLNKRLPRLWAYCRSSPFLSLTDMNLKKRVSKEGLLWDDAFWSYEEYLRETGHHQLDQTMYVVSIWMGECICCRFGSHISPGLDWTGVQLEEEERCDPPLHCNLLQWYQGAWTVLGTFLPSEKGEQLEPGLYQMPIFCWPWWREGKGCIFSGDRHCAGGICILCVPPCTVVP